MKFPSTMLAQKAQPLDIQKADLDLLDKINKLYTELSSVGSSNEKGRIWGLTLSNNTADATNDIDIAAGEASDNSDGTLMVLAAALTKQLDAVWSVGNNQGGRDTGDIADGWWAVWLIKRPDTGVVDALFSLSATAPTMPTDYTEKRRIGWVRRSSGVILAFVQTDERFILKALVNDRAIAAIPDTNRNLQTVTAPVGTVAILAVIHFAAGGNPHAWIRPTTFTDSAASATNRTLTATINVTAAEETEIEVDSSNQIAYRGDNTNLYLAFFATGWVDTRGRLA